MHVPAGQRRQRRVFSSSFLKIKIGNSLEEQE